MAYRRKEMPFRELGELLLSWRSARYRSALAMFKDAGAKKLPFSYSVYADFERGVMLPGVTALVELARFLNREPREAILAWARAQMPTEELKAMFGADRMMATQAATGPAPASATGTATGHPTFENSWVFGPGDRKTLLANPWFFDLWRALSLAFPHEVKFSDLKIPKRDVLKKWIASGHLIASRQGLKLRYPHLHMPRTPEWNDVRLNNMRRTLELLGRQPAASGEPGARAYRELVHRTLTEAQAAAWAARLRALEDELKALPYDTGEVEKMYALLVAFGPRS